MAEIRCPMCSRMNPAELDTCQFCQARLKPLILNPTPAPDPVPSNGKATPKAEEEVPDWLRALREKKGEEVSQQESSSEPTIPADTGEEIAPAWGLSEFLSTENTPDELAEDTDWLNRIRQRSQDESQDAPAEPEASLSWSVDSQEKAGPSDDGSEPAPAAENEPDWLARLRTGPLDPNKVPPVEPPEPAVSAEPNDPPTGAADSFWDQQESGALAVDEPEDAAPLDVQPGELPSWLQGLMSAAPTGSLRLPEDAPQENDPSAAPFEESLDAWLTASSATAVSDEPAEVPPSEPEITAPIAQVLPELPELFELPELPELPEIQADRSVESGPAPASTPDPFAAWDEVQADQPVQAFEAAEEDAPVAAPLDPFDEGGSGITHPVIESEDGLLPEWLASLNAADIDLGPMLPLSNEQSASPSSEETFAEPAAEAELPDWLVGLGAVELENDLPAEAAEAEVPAAAEPGEEILPAELPNWIQAMRPIETISSKAGAPEPAEVQAEKEGPLAGLQGVLPVHPLRSPYRKASAYSVELQASETQSSYAQILQDMISTETAARPLPEPKKAARSQVLVRSIVAVILLASIVYPLFSHLRMLPIPNLYPQEILNVRSAIEDVPENSSVLLVSSYEPALAGEIETSAVGVLDHLMARSVRLAVMTTQPTGLALSANLFDKAFQLNEPYHQPYQSGEKLATLGYLAGGPGGMLSFAQRPQIAVPGLLPDGSTVWEKPMLDGVVTLSDFKLVVVLTDSADTGRAWVEQVKPYLGDTPLLFVTSAQAAPVLYPYLDSQQIYGMVSGLAGGAAYEQIMGRPGLGSAYWDAFQTGILVTIIVILLGGMTNAIIGVVKNRSSEGEA